MFQINVLSLQIIRAEKEEAKAQQELEGHDKIRQKNLDKIVHYQELFTEQKKLHK